jgi:hypothetical protein
MGARCQRCGVTDGVPLCEECRTFYTDYLGDWMVQAYRAGIDIVELAGRVKESVDDVSRWMEREESVSAKV